MEQPFGDSPMENYTTEWTAIVLKDGKVSSFKFNSDSRPDEAYRVISKIVLPDNMLVLGLILGDNTKKFWGVDLEKQKIIYHKS